MVEINSYKFIEKFEPNHKLSIRFLFQTINQIHYQVQVLNTSQFPQKLIFHFHHQQIHQVYPLSYNRSKNLFHSTQTQKMNPKNLSFQDISKKNDREARLEYQFRQHNIQLYKTLFKSYSQLFISVQTESCMVIAVATLNINEILQSRQKIFQNELDNKNNSQFEVTLTFRKLISYHQNLNIGQLPPLFKLNLRGKVQYQTISPLMQQISENFTKQLKSHMKDTIVSKSSSKGIETAQINNRNRFINSKDNKKVQGSPKKTIVSSSKQRGSSPHHKKQYVNSLTNTKCKNKKQNLNDSSQKRELTILDGEQIKLQVSYQQIDSEDEIQPNFHQEQNIKNQSIKLLQTQENYDQKRENRKLDSKKQGLMEFSIQKSIFLLSIMPNNLFRIKLQKGIKSLEQFDKPVQNVLFRSLFNIYLYPQRLKSIKFIKNLILQKCQSSIIQHYFFKSDAQLEDIDIQMFPIGTKFTFKKSAGGFMIYYKLFQETYQKYKQRVITSQGQIKLQAYHVELTINLKDKKTNQIIIQQFNAQISSIESVRTHTYYQIYVEDQGFYKMDMNSFIKQKTLFEIQSKSNDVLSVVNGSGFQLTKQNSLLIVQLHKKVRSQLIYLTVDDWKQGQTSLIKLNVIHKQKIARLFNKKDPEKQKQKSGKKEQIFLRINQKNAIKDEY